MDSPPPDAVERLRLLDACAVSDAIDRLGGAETVAAPGIAPLTRRQRIAGRAVTVELGHPRPDAPPVHLCAAAVAAAGPDDVIVVAHQGRDDCAGWGGNLSRAARRQGAAGVIVHGAVRDVDEATDIGFAVYATAATPRTARGRAQEVAWGKPVQVAGVTVATGDYVVADATGVVFVPAAEVGDVLDEAEAIAEKEAAMAADLEAGRPVTEVLGAGYEHMLERGGDRG